MSPGNLPGKDIAEGSIILNRESVGAVNILGYYIHFSGNPVVYQCWSSIRYQYEFSMFEMCKWGRRRDA